MTYIKGGIVYCVEQVRHTNAIECRPEVLGRWEVCGDMGMIRVPGSLLTTYECVLAQARRQFLHDGCARQTVRHCSGDTPECTRYLSNAGFLLMGNAFRK